MAVTFSNNSYNNRCGSLKAYLQTACNLGKDEYISDVPEAFRMLKNCVPPKPQTQKFRIILISGSSGDNEDQELGLLRDEDNEKQHYVVTRTYCRFHPNFKCDYCEEFGNFKDQLPKLKDKSASKEAILLKLNIKLMLFYVARARVSKQS